MLGRLLRPPPDDRLAALVDPVGEPVAVVDRHRRNHPGERLRDVVEGVVIVVEDDHQPVAAESRPGVAGARALDRLSGHARVVRLSAAGFRG